MMFLILNKKQRYYIPLFFCSQPLLNLTGISMNASSPEAANRRALSAHGSQRNFAALCPAACRRGICGVWIT
jgi:hypothetical protein